MKVEKVFRAYGQTDGSTLIDATLTVANVPDKELEGDLQYGVYTCSICVICDFTYIIGLDVHPVADN